MKVKLVFDDWRRPAGGSIYATPDGVVLSMGDFHSGTTFDAEISLDRENTIELTEAVAHGYVPVFTVALP